MVSAQHNFRFKAALQTVGCTASAYAVLSALLVTKKLTQQQISQIATGTREFESEQEAAEHFRVLDAMQHLSEIVTPKVPIAWNDPLRVKDALTKTFEERRNHDDPIIVQCFYVRLSIMNFLKGINSAGVVTTINYHMDGAAFEDYDLALRAVQELQKTGTKAKVERLTAPRRKSTIVTSLEEIGFKDVSVEL
jgi:hypothetical protein